MIRRAIFWLAVAWLGVTYAGMPALILLRARLLRRPVASEPITPPVSIIIAAHNEADAIGDRIANLLALDYPRDRLEIVIVSDGSTDGTDDIVASHAADGVRLVAPGRVGKGAALAAAVAASSGEILVFSDANSHYAPDAVRALVRPFADPEVGGVAGNQVYRQDAGADGIELGERGYWDFDRLLKRSQSAAGNVTSGTGAIYAIRRGHFGPIPEGVTDDLLNTIRVVDHGERLVFAEDAMAFEPVAPSGVLEYRRKVRIMVRSFRCLWVMRRLFDPRHTGFYAVQLFWHKVMLRTASLPLLALLVLSPLLWWAGPIYRLATLGQAVCYALAAAGIALIRRPIGKHPALAVPGYFTLVNIASLHALWNVVRGRRIDRWEPRRTVEPTRPELRVVDSARAGAAASSAADASDEDPPTGRAIA